jgi:hypothetical protein
VLRAEGHICNDAEKHLTELKSVAELLR